MDHLKPPRWYFGLILGERETSGPAANSADIVEILRIRADLLEQGPLRFDVREVLLALIFAATLFHQAVLAPDAFQRVVADPQIESRIKRRARHRQPHKTPRHIEAQVSPVTLIPDRRQLESLKVPKLRITKQIRSLQHQLGIHPVVQRSNRT